jgi:hypothetical protein
MRPMAVPSVLSSLPWAISCTSNVHDKQNERKQCEYEG